MAGSNMRDIRNDLRERLAVLSAKQCDEMASYQDELARLDASHREAIRAIERERAAIGQLLAIEEERAASGSGAPIERSEPVVPLADFLIAKVRSSGPLEKDELRAAADEAGYCDGRAFHATLMNITKGGRLVQDLAGRYITAGQVLDCSLGAIFGATANEREEEVDMLKLN